MQLDELKKLTIGLMYPHRPNFLRFSFDEKITLVYGGVLFHNFEGDHDISDETLYGFAY